MFAVVVTETVWSSGYFDIFMAIFHKVVVVFLSVFHINLPTSDILFKLVLF